MSRRLLLRLTASNLTLAKLRQAGKLRSFAGRSDGGRLVDFAPAGDRGDDLAAVEAAVFDEDVRGLLAADDDASDVDAGDVGFQGVRITLGTADLRIQLNSLLLQKLEIRVVASHRENMDGGDGMFRS